MKIMATWFSHGRGLALGGLCCELRSRQGEDAVVSDQWRRQIQWRTNSTCVSLIGSWAVWSHAYSESETHSRACGTI